MGRRGWTMAMVLLPAALGASIAAAQHAVATEPPGPNPIPKPTPHRIPTPRPKSLVVLDPGHGGSNTGAASVMAGVFEKDLTLALARAVKERLEERGIRVKLTRDGDEYVSLRERTRRANAAEADLFISLHANASPARSQRGFETYLLTPQALDVDARALRRHEGRPRPGVAADTAALLDDAERGLAHRASAGLAAAMQAELGERRTGDRGVRQASMDVLYGAAMPSVLVEVGFIDHPIEGAELLDPAVLASIADAIADAAASQIE